MESLPFFEDWGIFGTIYGTAAVVAAAVAVVTLLTVIHFLPTIVGRNKKNSVAIFALNFFAGWTFIGWIVAMVWACTKDSPEDERLARPLAIRTILTLMVLLNCAVLGGLFYLGYFGAKAVQEEVAAEEARQAEVAAAAAKASTLRAERALVDAQASAEEARLQAELEARLRAEAEARELQRKREEFAELPQWDRYGRPINRDFEIFLAGGEQTAAPTAAAEPARSMFPPGVDTPEERREYLRAYRASQGR